MNEITNVESMMNEITNESTLTLWGWLVSLKVLDPKCVCEMEGLGVLIAETQAGWVVMPTYAYGSAKLHNCSKIWVLLEEGGRLTESAVKWIAYFVKKALGQDAEGPDGEGKYEAETYLHAAFPLLNGHSPFRFGMADPGPRVDVLPSGGKSVRRPFCLFELWICDASQLLAKERSFHFNGICVVFTHEDCSVRSVNLFVEEEQTFCDAEVIWYFPFAELRWLTCQEALREAVEGVIATSNLSREADECTVYLEIEKVFRSFERQEWENYASDL